MDKKTVFIKTQKGESEMSSLSGDMKRVLLLIDGKLNLEAVTKHAPPSLRGDLPDIMQRLLDAELIRDKERQIASPKITAPRVVAPKMVAPQKEAELDFTTMFAAPSPAAMAEEAAKHKARLEAEAKAKLEAEAKAKREADSARERAALEAAVAAAKLKAVAEAEEKAQAKARLEAETAARAKAEAEARTKHEAAERLIAETKAKQEAEARMRAEQEVARVKAELEAAARAKAEAEVRARAEREAAEKARREAEEAARIKAEIEAAERAKAEAEARARAEREAAEKARREAEEAARIKAEQEAARVRAELEAAAKAKADAEAARVKAEQEAARVRAELEAARVRAEAEAKALAEQRAKQEAEAAKLKAELEAQRIKAEQEAAARAQVEERAKAEAANNKAEQPASSGSSDDQVSLRAKVEAAERARKEELAAHASDGREGKAAPVPKQETKAAPSPFQIDLGGLDIGRNQMAEPVVPTPVPEPEVKPEPVVAKHEAEHRVAEESKVAVQQPFQNVAQEMERLKAEQEAARLRAEQEARKQQEEKALAAEQADAWAEAEQRAKLQAKMESEQAAQQAVLSQAKAATKAAVARAPRQPMPIGKIFFGLIFLSLLAVVVLPYVWPLQEYVLKVEQRISAQLKQPVHIGGMTAATFPPKLQLQNVTVGNAQEVKLTAVTLNFDPVTLFSDSKAISNAELQGITLDGKSLEQIALWLKGMGGDAEFPVRHLTIQNLLVNVEGISLPALKGLADLEQGAFTRVVMYSEDSKVRVELQPVQNRWQLSFGIKERALPLFPDVMFSDFSAKGDIADGEVNFAELDAHAYGGILSGSAKLNWRKGWQLQGRIQAKTMELDKMFKQFGLAGEIFADGTFSAQGVKLTQLGDSPKLEGSFEAKKGVINGIDMVETARLSSREHLGGGRTHFDSLTGAVQLDNHILHFRQIRIGSGMLTASGSFDVQANNQLSGSFNSEIKARAGNNPLVLSGTLNEPKLVAR